MAVKIGDLAGTNPGDGLGDGPNMSWFGTTTAADDIKQAAGAPFAQLARHFFWAFIIVTISLGRPALGWAEMLQSAILDTETIC